MANLFQTQGADAAYSRWQEPADLHEEDACQECHEWHLIGSEVIGNALDSAADYPCCVAEFEEMKRTGKVCATHPRAYFEPATHEHAAYCEDCPEVKP